jgi:hypothetical protein
VQHDMKQAVGGGARQAAMARRPRDGVLSGAACSAPAEFVIVARHLQPAAVKQRVHAPEDSSHRDC